MGIKVTIESAKSIEKGIWKARLKPQETSAFGDCSSKSGPYSVLLLTTQADFNEHSQSITFNPNATRLLNVGTTNQIIIISATLSQKEVSQVFEQSSDTEPAKPIAPPDTSAQKQEPEYTLSQALSTGDKLFLSELPPDLRRIGETLLYEVRKHFKGELSYEPRSAKFDETPEIFWTVKIQPEDSSLRITVRGTPDDFPDLEDIDLKVDKFGYSAFVITNRSQIPGAVTAIQQAAKNIK